MAWLDFRRARASWSIRYRNSADLGPRRCPEIAARGHGNGQADRSHRRPRLPGSDRCRTERVPGQSEKHCECHRSVAAADCGSRPEKAVRLRIAQKSGARIRPRLCKSPPAGGTLSDLTASVIEALRPLIADPGLRRRFGSESRRKVVREFDLDYVNRRLLAELYRFPARREPPATALEQHLMSN